jgi:23S rRNA (uracil1939-C5)-methyltransferase
MARKEKNAVIESVEVTDYAAEGKSLARVEGKVIFIEGAVPGDVVDLRLGKNKKDWAEGTITKFHRYSKERVEPFCEHFGVCGGCQWQMLPYAQQLKFKQQQVEDSLKRIGKLNFPPILPIIGAGQTTRYRNKMEYTFGNRRFLLPDELNNVTIRVEQPVAGFHAKGVFDKVVNINTCHLQDEPSNQLRLAIRDFAIQQKFPFYDIKQHSGWLRTMQVRVCTTGEVMLNVVVGYEDREKIEMLCRHLLEKFPSLTTLLYTVNPKFNDSLYDLEPKPLKGPGYVIEQMEDFRFKIGPKSFFQTNTRQGEKLYQVARDFAELKGSETVYDLYCGTGSIGIFVSRQAGKIIGVETVDEAVEDAKINAELNGIRHARFFAGDVIRVCTDDFFDRHGKPDVIITDPPRAGMHEQLVRKILEIRAPVVVYVSCNPATQARDLAMLGEGYEITKVQPVDMFPHTHHIENVVQLKLR